MADENKKIVRTFNGIVVSDSMDKTIVVRVQSAKKHPKYLKHYTSHAKYKVHDPENKFKVGDSVQFVETRPISKEKRWKVIYS